MDREAWWPAVHGVEKESYMTKHEHMHAHTYTYTHTHTLPSRSIHAVANGKISFFSMAELYCIHSVYIHRVSLSIHPSMNS